jgi:hypothetical protein
LKLKNKKNFLDMNKHNDFLNYNDNIKLTANLKMYNDKKIEFSRNLEKGIKNKFERSISLPKIDVNNEQKVISSLFTQQEIEKLENLFMEKYNDESKFESFLNKIKQLEKGNDTENDGTDMLNEECAEMDKEIRESEELLRIEQFKLKEKNIDIAELNKKFKNMKRKNIIMKKEEIKLKNLLKNAQEKNKKKF